MMIELGGNNRLMANDKRKPWRFSKIYLKPNICFFGYFRAFSWQCWDTSRFAFLTILQGDSIGAGHIQGSHIASFRIGIGKLSRHFNLLAWLHTFFLRILGTPLTKMLTQSHEEQNASEKYGTQTHADVENEMTHNARRTNPASGSTKMRKTNAHETWAKIDKQNGKWKKWAISAQGRMKSFD